MSSHDIVLYKRKSSQTLPYLIGVGIIFILEMFLIVVGSRIWLNWSQTLLVTVIYVFIALLLLYWLFWVPMRVPCMLTKDNLILRYGHSLSVKISLDNIVSVEETNEQTPLMVPFGMENDKESGIMFMNTGNTHKLLVKLFEPIELKGLFKNYGYSDRIVFNIDEPCLLREMFGPQEDSVDPPQITNTKDRVHRYS